MLKVPDTTRRLLPIYAPWLGTPDDFEGTRSHRLSQHEGCDQELLTLIHKAHLDVA
jgi:hypothetical protein